MGRREEDVVLRQEELLRRDRSCSRMPWNPHTQDTARRPQGQDQAGLHSETLSQSKQNQTTKPNKTHKKESTEVTLILNLLDIE